MTLTTWLTFTAACIVFSIAPGAGTVASISTSLSGGLSRAVTNLIGLELALAAHLVVVSLGLGALLASSATAFTLVKYLGAGYLLYLGITKLLTKDSARLEEGGNGKTAQITGKKLIAQGFLVNMTNPKSIVFLAAFLPQFITPGSGTGLQYLILGATVIAVDGAVMFAYAAMAHLARPHVSSPRFMKLQDRIFGALFILIGVSLARAHR